MSKVTPRGVVAGLAAGAVAAGGFVFPPSASAYEYTVIAQSQMSVVEASSVEATGEGTNGPGRLVLDGDSATYWHTQWQPTKTPGPHHITVDLGGTVQLGQVKLTPRQTSTGSGRVHEYRLDTAVGADCATATYTTAATGSFPGDVATYAEDRLITLATPVQADCVKLVYLSSWGGNAGGSTTSPSEVVASLAEFNAYTATGDPVEEPTPDPVEVVVPEGAIELVDGSLKVRLHPDFPQVVDYRLGADQLAGRLGAPLTSVLINEVTQRVNVAAPVRAADGKSATYALTFPNLSGVTMTAKVSVADGTMRFTLTDLVDPANAVNRVRIPNHNLVTVTSDDAAAQLTAGMMHVNRNASADRFEALASTAAGDVQGSWMVVANNSKLAAAFDTNATEDNTAGGTSAGRVQAQNNRYQRQIATQGTAKHGSVWAGTWTWLGAAAETYLGQGPAPIGRDADPYVEVKITADANADSVVDWQDGAVATRDIVEYGLGADNVKDEVVSRIPFNIVSQATHPFLRTLDDTKRISLATDNLRQKVLLKGYQSEGHDAAHPDYAGHYNERAGGLEDLTTLVNEGELWNSTFGVHVNATETYSEAYAFSEDLLRMPPQAAWGWMNQSYYIDGPKDLGRGNVLERFQEFRDEVPTNLSWLYIDVYWPYGWEMERLGDELTEMGWGLASEWSDRFPEHTVWSHWSQEEAYGGATNKGVNSQLVRFVYNSKRDTWNPHPILSNSNLVDFEGWTGHQNYNGFINNVWQRNLPVKFLQQSDIVKWETNRIAFANGTVATSPLTTIGGSVIPTDREITFDGATVYADGSYLFPWSDGGTERLYAHSIAGGEQTWELTDAWKSQTSLTLFKLTDTGRVKVADVAVTGGSISFTAEANVAYVLYPTSAVPAAKVPNWGQGSGIEDPGFFSGTLNAYDTTGDVKVVKTNLGNFQAEFGAGAGTISQELALPAGTHNAWAWVEIQPGQQRLASIEVTGAGVAPAGYAEGAAGKVANSITTSPVINATASDEKKRTYFQRLRVTFTSTGQPVTLTLRAGEGTARVSVDDLRVVDFVAPADAGDTAQTVFFEDFENIDTGYYPFVTGAANIGGDARTQLAEKHAPYSQKGWYGINSSNNVVQGGKLNDNVLSGEWSLMANNENAGEILKTANGSIPFKTGHRYRVSFDYQTTYADQYRVRIGHDTPNGSGFTTTNLLTDLLDQQRDTAKYSREFTAATCDAYFLAVDKLAGQNSQHNMTIDNIRVEDLGVDPAADPTCMSATIAAEGGTTVDGGDVITVTTTVNSFEDDEVTGIRQTLTVPDGWEVELLAAGDTGIGSGEASIATWVVRVPRDVTDTTLTLTATGTVGGESVTVQADQTLNVMGANEVYLSDLRDRLDGTPTNAWGPVEWDKANGESQPGDGTPLTLAGTVYQKGIGVHAASTIRFDLAGLECTTFSATVGIDDSRGTNGSVQFQVFGDGVAVSELTPVLRGRADPITLREDITGVDVLELRVTGAGDGVGSDHGDWALARVACGESEAPQVAPVVEVPASGTVGQAVTLNLSGYAPSAETSVVEIYVGGVRAETAEIAADGTGTGTVKLPSSAGQATIEARQWGSGVNATTYPASKVTVTVNPAAVNRPPAAFTVANATVEAGSPVSVTAKTTDPEGGELSYSAAGLPRGVRINSATGQITGSTTVVGAHRITVSATDAQGARTSATFTLTVNAKTVVPREFPRTAPYTLAGEHLINGRSWRTVCEDYSQTERCRTDIWASVVKRTGNTYSIERGWAFNNLTYLPFMTRAQWATNPLGRTGQFTGTDAQPWRTECDTAATGSNGCRSYRLTTVYSATPKAGGGYTFAQKNQWVFNNIVMFGNYTR